MLLILFGLPFLAIADSIRVNAAEDAVTLQLADGRTILLDGLLAPKADDAGGRSAADQIAAAGLAQVIESPIGQDVWLEALTEAPDRWKRFPAGVYIQKSGVWLHQRMLQEGFACIGACLLGGADRLKMLRDAEAGARQA
jgi:hypothetical protein